MHNSAQGSSIYDVAIIGAGPVGLFAITSCGMLGLRTVCIENSTFVGGQCVALYAEKRVYGIPGMVHETGDEFAARLAEQANEFNPKLLLGHELKSVWMNKEEHFTLRTSNADVFARAIILASGKGAFAPNRPPLEGIEKFEGKTVLYSVKSKEEFKGKTVCIAGGGDSAADWCLELVGIAKKIILVHRREKFRCVQRTEERIKKIIADGGAIEIKAPFQLHGLEGTDDGKLKKVHLTSNEGNEETIKCDFLLPFFGLANKGANFEIEGIELSEDKKIIVNPSTMESSVGGIFAIGDASSYRGKIAIITTGFQEAIHAADNIKKRLKPEDEKDIFLAVTKNQSAD